jgi:hypothetical protein
LLLPEPLPELVVPEPLPELPPELLVPDPLPELVVPLPEFPEPLLGFEAVVPEPFGEPDFATVSGDRPPHALSNNVDDAKKTKAVDIAKERAHTLARPDKYKNISDLSIGIEETPVENPGLTFVIWAYLSVKSRPDTNWPEALSRLASARLGDYSTVHTATFQGQLITLAELLVMRKAAPLIVPLEHTFGYREHILFCERPLCKRTSGLLSRLRRGRRLGWLQGSAELSRR